MIVLLCWSRLKESASEPHPQPQGCSSQSVATGCANNSMTIYGPKMFCLTTRRSLDTRSLLCCSRLRKSTAEPNLNPKPAQTKIWPLLVPITQPGKLSDETWENYLWSKDSMFWLTTQQIVDTECFYVGVDWERLANNVTWDLRWPLMVQRFNLATCNSTKSGHKSDSMLR